jgi:hypothetical protein
VGSGAHVEGGHLMGEVDDRHPRCRSDKDGVDDADELVLRPVVREKVDG